MKKINLNIASGDALLIVPPFASTNMPCLGVHILQACAKAEGLDVKVLYANLIFASMMGEVNYEAICRMSIQHMLGERLFTAAAYGMAPLGQDNFLERIKDAHLHQRDQAKKLTTSELVKWSKLAADWADEMAEAICKQGFRVMGCTSTFEQTASSIALMSRVKRLSPNTVTVLGGANCEAEMAEGMLSLSDAIDYVFSGESERAFPKFLRDSHNDLPARRVIQGEPCLNLDEIPLVDFSEFFHQHRFWLADSELAKAGEMWVPYETSRGCWWGQKRQCTFCGLNGKTITYRQKSAERAFADIKTLVDKYPTNRVCMADNNMPYSYFKTLLPRLAEELPNIQIFYELKANLSFTRMQALEKAGISLAQPGIESLSTLCLKLMRKGVNARQNINLLRYARSIGVGLSWNILYALPGDKLSEYEKMLALLPLIRHLPPPLGLSHLSLERFSRYLLHPDEYKITCIQPLPIYKGIFPEFADREKLAYHFEAEYTSESKEQQELMREFESSIETWRESWKGEGELPSLALTDLGGGRYLLLDTRGLPGNPEISLISEDKAVVVITGTPVTGDSVDWARERKLLVEVDNQLIPLATSEPALFQKFGHDIHAETAG